MFLLFNFTSFSMRLLEVTEFLYMWLKVLNSEIKNIKEYYPQFNKQLTHNVCINKGSTAHTCTHLCVYVNFVMYY